MKCSPNFCYHGQRLGERCCPDYRRKIFGRKSWICCGHVTPEAAVGGLIGLLINGDPITIDAENNLLSLDLPEDEIARRQEAWKSPEPREKRGVLAKYAKLVSSASLGAVTH